MMGVSAVADADELQAFTGLDLDEGGVLPQRCLRLECCTLWRCSATLSCMAAASPRCCTSERSVGTMVTASTTSMPTGHGSAHPRGGGQGGAL